MRWRRLFWFTLFVSLIAILFIGVSIVWLQMATLLTPRRVPLTKTPAEYNLPYQNIRLITADGVDIGAWYIKGTRPQSMVLVHGIHGNRQQMLEEAVILNQAGYHLLLLDLRGHGESGSAMLTYGHDEAYDVMAAVDYLANLPEVTQIGLSGHSMGGAVVARAATQDERVAVLIIQNSYSSLNAAIDEAFEELAWLPQWPFAPMIIALGEYQTGVEISTVDSAQEVARFNPRPVMIIHGTKDSLFSVEHAHRLIAAAHDPKQFWLIEGMGHEMTAAYDSFGYQTNVLPFLEEAW